MLKCEEWSMDLNGKEEIKYKVLLIYLILRSLS